ncbi:hypothetical protein BGW80DRAFT_583194 [Lactifluus volemus]|nr:hypothetical protein BGW80DRAFT_583194 [Lactifluus volemus]
MLPRTTSVTKTCNPFEDPFAPPRSCSPILQVGKSPSPPGHPGLEKRTHHKTPPSCLLSIPPSMSQFPPELLLHFFALCHPPPVSSAITHSPSPSRPHPTSPLSPERIQIRHLLRHHPYVTIAFPTTLTSILSRSLQLSICYS